MVNNPRKFGIRQPKKLLAILNTEESEVNAILDTVRISYPCCIAYKYLSNTYTNQVEDFHLYLGEKVSVDIDMQDRNDWYKVSNEVKKDLIQENIHSDIQYSLHGVHLIVNKSQVPKIYEIIKKYRNQYFLGDESKLRIDVISMSIPVDGQTIVGFTFRTVENWT